jgi:geranylgeranyl transferase type-1 subunit beta
MCVASGSEADMRFAYCACAISTFINDWSGVDKDRLVKFILSSQVCDRRSLFVCYVSHWCSSDTMVALPKRQDSNATVCAYRHLIRCRRCADDSLSSVGSSTYLAVSSLFLMGRLDALPSRDAVIRWCLQRQICGFQVRCLRMKETIETHKHTAV